MIDVPRVLAENAVHAWGDEGRRWLAELPDVLDAVRRDWGVEVGEIYSLSYNWVARARRADGTLAVLKLGPPGPGHLAQEAAALAAYGGDGAVRLLAHDAARGALLLERAEPGTMARDLVPGSDEDATAVAIGVLRRLHAAPVPEAGLLDLHTLRRGFVGHLARYPGDDPLPRGLVVAALTLFDELCASAPRRVVLHGDLHHDNILRSGQEGWLAIDPHGYAGDPGFDTGPLLYNPDPGRRDPTLLALVPRRVEQLADGLGLPLERVTRWGFVAAMLSEVWDAGDGRSGGRALAVARLLAATLPMRVAIEHDGTP
ncbi:aminoglycoside phosphotransferase family protein [Pseudonocardia xinjiangensis]|uniref:Phosphotransferase n=1 Tax=Pseudonocardia xinjiangensis TaxID=75289 RepID=A0ABX1RPF2_9PSEU|nr:aminoglycoside phosphotransferase family protein [Pseudonocardia xinjiangensis]NMH81128.1 phosphotransferase [Pseudonocardia xinjiangensis]